MNTIKTLLSLGLLIALLNGCTTLDADLALRQAIRSQSTANTQRVFNTHSHQIGATDGLIVAAQERDIAAVDHFLSRRAAINQRNGKGETALTVAAKAINPGMVEHLIRRGANPERRDWLGYSALDYATQWSPWHAAVVDQKALIAQYLMEIAEGKQPAMAQIAKAIAERHTHVWNAPGMVTEKLRVVNLYSSVIR